MQLIYYLYFLFFVVLLWDITNPIAIDQILERYDEQDFGFETKRRSTAKPTNSES